MIWTSDLLYVTSLCLSKLSIAFLFRRFSAAPQRIRTFSIFVAAAAVYGLIGIMIVALQQDILHPWRHSEATASSTLHRWIAFGAFGIALDVAALAAPFYLIWGIQMDVRSKTRVAIAFWFRGPVIVLSSLRLFSLSKLTGNDFTWAYVTP